MRGKTPEKQRTETRKHTNGLILTEPLVRRSTQSVLHAHIEEISLFYFRRVVAQQRWLLPVAFLTTQIESNQNQITVYFCLLAKVIHSPVAK